MITVAEAESIVLNATTDFGSEFVEFDGALGRVLAKDIVADRDIPPYNRVAMDGIAINFNAIEQGIRSFRRKGVQAAGDQPLEIENVNECVEIMTGCALPSSTDTIVRYEDVNIADGMATIETGSIKKAQNVHTKGKDKMQGETLVKAGQIITPAIINSVASVGATKLWVKRLPRVVIISTGNELVAIDQDPSAHQIRQSNNHAIKAVLKSYGLEADLLHIPDAMEWTKRTLEDCLEKYEVLLLSGGVSAGKFDYLPQALEAAGVEKLFYKVAQKPGKPFWFGKVSGAVVFAFPGNPVSTFLCLHRYMIPWLKASLGLQNKIYKAALEEDVQFSPPLHYFLQVKLQFNEPAQLIARPVAGNGSGDLVSLSVADAFIELPADKEEFREGELFRVWPFKELI
jgi:molybdopterin molybdotransferase